MYDDQDSRKSDPKKYAKCRNIDDDCMVVIEMLTKFCLRNFEPSSPHIFDAVTSSTLFVCLFCLPLSNKYPNQNWMIIKNEENMFFHLVSCISPNWVFSSSAPRPSLLLDSLADTEAEGNLKAKENTQKD